MSRRRINRSRQRKEWRRQRVEELKHLSTLIDDALKTYHHWHWVTHNTMKNKAKGEELRNRLRQRTDRRCAVYEAAKAR